MVAICLVVNNKVSRPDMSRERLTQLMVHLTDNTVLWQLLIPMRHALASVRWAAALGRVLGMEDFVALGVLRHLRGMTRLREQVQALLHLDPAEATLAPLPRSTWSDALSRQFSQSRLAVYLKKKEDADGAQRRGTRMRRCRIVIFKAMGGIPFPGVFCWVFFFFFFYARGGRHLSRPHRLHRRVADCR